MSVSNGWSRVEGAGNMWVHEDGRGVAGREGQTIEDILHEVDTAAPLPAEEPASAVPADLTVGEFVGRFDPESDQDLEWFLDLDARMVAENALVRRQWANPANLMREGVGIWNIIARHLEAIGVPAPRRAELMAPAGVSAALAEEASAA